MYYIGYTVGLYGGRKYHGVIDSDSKQLRLISNIELNGEEYRFDGLTGVSSLDYHIVGNKAVIGAVFTKSGKKFIYELRCLPKDTKFMYDGELIDFNELIIGGDLYFLNILGDIAEKSLVYGVDDESLHGFPISVNASDYLLDVLEFRDKDALLAFISNSLLEEELISCSFSEKDLSY